MTVLPPVDDQSSTVVFVLWSKPNDALETATAAITDCSDGNGDGSGRASLLRLRKQEEDLQVSFNLTFRAIFYYIIMHRCHPAPFCCFLSAQSLCLACILHGRRQSICVFVWQCLLLRHRRKRGKGRSVIHLDCCHFAAFLLSGVSLRPPVVGKKSFWRFCGF